jgi:hypothetical protein
MSLPNSPFKLISHPHHANVIAFEAEFALPDDGLISGSNKLVVRIFMESESSDECTVELISRTSKDRRICINDGIGIEALANPLYGFARLKTKQFLEIGGWK